MPWAQPSIECSSHVEIHDEILSVSPLAVGVCCLLLFVTLERARSEQTTVPPRSCDTSTSLFARVASCVLGECAPLRWGGGSGVGWARVRRGDRSRQDT